MSVVVRQAQGPPHLHPHLGWRRVRAGSHLVDEQAATSKTASLAIAGVAAAALTAGSKKARLPFRAYNVSTHVDSSW